MPKYPINIVVTGLSSSHWSISHVTKFKLTIKPVLKIQFCFTCLVTYYSTSLNTFTL